MHVCKMATITSDDGLSDDHDDGVLFGEVEWSSSPVTFHRNKGKNVKLTESNTVATRNKSFYYGIVFTSEPMVAGQILKVTMTERGGIGCGMVRAHLVCIAWLFITVIIFTKLIQKQDAHRAITPCVAYTVMILTLWGMIVNL